MDLFYAVFAVGAGYEEDEGGHQEGGFGAAANGCFWQAVQAGQEAEQQSDDAEEYSDGKACGGEGRPVFERGKVWAAYLDGGGRDGCCGFHDLSVSGAAVFSGAVHSQIMIGRPG